MKLRLIIGFAVILSLGICSCESNRLRTDQEETGEWVEISLMMASKGSPDSEIDPDYEIGSVRVLAFHAVTGQLKFNSGKIDLSTTPPPLTLEVLTGQYDFVFIANEHSVADDLLTARLDGWLAGSNKVLKGLDQEAFHYNAFSTDKHLPATSIYRDVTIQSDDIGNPLWEVEVERLAVRLDIQLLVDAKWLDDITGIRFANLPDRVPFFPNKLSNNSVNYYEGGYPETYPLSHIPIDEFTMTGPDEDGRYTYSLERIILPASVFPDIANEAKAIAIEVHTSSAPQQPLRRALGQAVPADYTSSRNLYYKIEGNITEEAEKPVRLLFIVTTDEWTIENIQDNVGGGVKKLNVDKISIPVSGLEVTRVHFWSDQPYVIVAETGYTGVSGPTTFSVNDYFSDLAGPAASNLHYNPLTGVGCIDIRAKEGVNLPSDKLRIYLDAGGLRREVVLSIDN